MAATYCILDDAYFYLKVLKPHLQVLFTTYPLLKSSILCRAPKIIPFSDWFWEYGVPFPMGEGFIWQGCLQAWNIEPTWQRWLLAGKILRLLWKQSFIVSINKWVVWQFWYFPFWIIDYYLRVMDNKGKQKSVVPNQQLHHQNCNKEVDIAKNGKSAIKTCWCCADFQIWNILQANFLVIIWLTCQIWAKLNDGRKLQWGKSLVWCNAYWCTVNIA